MIRAVLIACGLWLTATVVWAHESLPASLILEERAPKVFEVDWRIPATQGYVLPITPRFPRDCVALSAPERAPAPGAERLRWRIRCDHGLRNGASIAFDGLEATLINVVVRAAYLDGHSQSVIASPRAPSVSVEPPAEARRSIDASGYFGLGVEHILTGYDHLLFVLCLILLTPNRWRLLKTITAFTVAHSITLAAAALGYVHVPGPPIEASIALSIVFLARELTRPEAERGISARLPWVMAFCFGLLHGLGFAGALAEVGLPPRDIPLALLLFNVGVEAGQLLFVSVVLAGLWALARLWRRWPAWSAQVAVYTVGSISTLWLLQRLVVVAAGP